MRFEIISKDVNEVAADAFGIPVIDENSCKEVLTELGEKLGFDFNGIIGRIPDFFSDEKTEVLFTKDGARIVFLAGVKGSDLISIERALGRIARKAREYRVKNLGLLIDQIMALTPADKIIPLISEAFLLSLYDFNKYKEKPISYDPNIEVITKKIPPEKGRELLNKGINVADGVNLTRDLVNEPANIANPVEIAQRVKEIFTGLNVEVDVYDEKYLEKNGFGGIIAVGKGSNVPPRLVVIKYLPLSNEKPLVFVGKGVCFDSGGLDLKSREGMELMKIDMAGAATVIGAIYSIAKLALQINVIGVVPLVENMPSGKATRPGDVIKMYNGKYVEVANTDAEGRLILADALAFAEKNFNPSRIIDLATLTGACVVALGKRIAGIMGNKNELISELLRVGRDINELLWELPLHEEYKEGLKSDVADLRNIARDRSAGAIVGGLFLSEFIERVPWAHLDIAGVAYSDKDRELCPKGATGFGVRLLVKYVLRLAES